MVLKVYEQHGKIIEEKYTHRNLSFDSLPNVSGMGPVNLFK